MSLILLDRRDAIAIVRLNRPEKLNALSRAMLEDLSDAFKQLEKQSDLRVVILTGSGKAAFCAGTDNLPPRTCAKAHVPFWKSAQPFSKEPDLSASVLILEVTS